MNQIIEKKIGEIKPYEKNAKKNLVYKTFHDIIDI